LNSELILEGLKSGQNKYKYGFGSDCFRLLAASIDIPESYQTNLIYYNDLMIKKQSEINLLRKIYWEMLKFLED